MIKVGQRIKEVRVQKGLSLEDVSKNIKIKKEFLLAIEEGNYDLLPSASYAQGFVRNYISFLGMPEKETIALFRREFDEENIFKVLPTGMANNSLPVSRVKPSQTVIVGLLVFLILLIFIAFQYKDAVFGPSITISEPSENEKVGSQVEIIGKTDPDSVVFIEGVEISTDASGNFRKVISLFEGREEINIKAVNRFNKETEIIRKVIVTP